MKADSYKIYENILSIHEISAGHTGTPGIFKSRKFVGLDYNYLSQQIFSRFSPMSAELIQIPNDC